MIPASLNISENSNTYELNLQSSDNTVSFSHEEHTPKYIGARANISENSNTYELNLQSSDNTVSFSHEEHTPKYIGARAYCTPTDDGAIITLIDYNGETSVEIKNGRSQLDDNDYTKIATTVLNLLQNSLANEVFMNVSEYDANRNGIVDNAESVNGYTVESNVPQNAEFTDTKYDVLTSLMIDDICDL